MVNAVVRALRRCTISSGLFPTFLECSIAPIFLCGRQATANAPKVRLRLLNGLLVTYSFRTENKTAARFGFSLKLHPQKSVFTSNSSIFQPPCVAFAVHCQAE